MITVKQTDGQTDRQTDKQTDSVETIPYRNIFAVGNIIIDRSPCNTAVKSRLQVPLICMLVIFVYEQILLNC